ncbi:MAG: xanthine dehydrogenase family protein molybdopterin-binding subunit, partial [Anaerolineaceae bacterium]|nr:xanthine dehydrogenase family protein molybdopterin-binding subunit [Anaerolineaceae bacterium]
LGVNYTFGATAAEIRIEKKTGKIIVDKFTSVFDVGQVINPKQIRGSVMGGVTMAVGAALYEKLDISEDGKINNPQLFKYHIPTYKEAIPMEIEFIETPDAVGPFGARGIGEHSVIGPAPAILNAIYDAVGVNIYEIPVTPAVMKKALEARQE